jgi:MFS family permease
MIAKTAPPHIKGTAMGVYSSSQFIGAFVGGAVGGYLHGIAGVEGVFIFCAFCLTVWGVVAATMKKPKYLGTFMLRIGTVNDDEAHHLVGELTAVRGVAEAIVIPEDGIAYLKVDNKALDRNDLVRFHRDE